MPNYTNYPVASNLNLNQVKDRIKKSIEAFFKLDSYLITNRLHEAAITHRLAIYLDEIFINYNIDCEWNKNLNSNKIIFTKDLLTKIKDIIASKIEQSDSVIKESEISISQFKKVRDLINNRGKSGEIKITDLSGDEILLLPKEDEDGRTIIKSVRPDIIIHHRGTRQNIVVIEVKKKNAGGKNNYEVAKYFDLIKLHALTSQPHLDYNFGFYIELPENNCHWQKIQITNSRVLNKIFGLSTKKVFEITFI